MRLELTAPLAHPSAAMYARSPTSPPPRRRKSRGASLARFGVLRRQPRPMCKLTRPSAGVPRRLAAALDGELGWARADPPSARLGLGLAVALAVSRGAGRHMPCWARIVQAQGPLNSSSSSIAPFLDQVCDIVVIGRLCMTPRSKPDKCASARCCPPRRPLDKRP